MDVEPIDPRDASWLRAGAVYRVYYWAMRGDAALSSDEWRITDAKDVHEVIGWAESGRGDRTYELFLEQVEPRQTPTGWVQTVGLIRLAGVDPSSSTTTTICLPAA